MPYYRRYQQYTPVSKFTSPEHISGFCTKEEGAKIVYYLTTYNGSFNLMVEMKNRFLGQNGYKSSGLSEKQWEVVRNSMKRDSIVQMPAFTPVSFATPIDITINRSAAFSHFKRKLGMKYAIFTLRVHAIKEVTPSRNGKYMRIKLLVSPNADGTVSSCRICGKPLTDHKSIATGVGPSCAKHIGAAKLYKSDVQAFMEAVKKEFVEIGLTEIELWDSSIMENSHIILDEIRAQRTASTPTAPTKKEEVVTIDINDIAWLPTDKSFVIDKTMCSKPSIQRLYDVLKSDLTVYVNILNTKTTNWYMFEFLHADNQSFDLVYKPSVPLATVNHLIIKN